MSLALFDTAFYLAVPVFYPTNSSKLLRGSLVYGIVSTEELQVLERTCPLMLSP